MSLKLYKVSAVFNSKLEIIYFIVEYISYVSKLYLPQLIGGNFIILQNKRIHRKEIVLVFYNTIFSINAFYSIEFLDLSTWSQFDSITLDVFKMIELILIFNLITIFINEIIVSRKLARKLSKVEIGLRCI